jgi:hypothetical protein
MRGRSLIYNLGHLVIPLSMATFGNASNIADAAKSLLRIHPVTLS